MLGANAVYDSARGEVIFFGGADTHCNGTCAETWAWDGTAWQRIPLLTSPSARMAPGMAFDESRQEVVLFGSGITMNSDGTMTGLSNDTWIWNGQEWLEQHPDISPPGRTANGNMLVYDKTRKTVMLFGGITQDGRASPPLNDTWLWDGKTWRQAILEKSPPADGNVFMFYDTLLDEVVLLTSNGTWLWNGETWQEGLPGIPSFWNFTGGSAGYDALHQQGVFVGINPNGSTLETWIWDEKQWVAARDAFPQPFYGRDVNLVYDTSRQTLLLFVFNFDKTVMLFDWSGGQWRPVYTCQADS
jgi:hypothetical protein